MAVGGQRAPSRDIKKDPYASFHFNVEIDGLKVSGFSEASGLSIEAAVETFREGGLNTHEIHLAGPSKFPSRLTLNSVQIGRASCRERV